MRMAALALGAGLIGFAAAAGFGGAGASAQTGAGVAEEPVGPEGDIDCDHLEAIDAAREANNRGFDRIYAAISTMTTASFCGYSDLSDEVDERIRTWIWRMDDRAASLSPEDEKKLKQVKASYVLGRQMIDRSN